eukprot:TRINITY_DN1135_c0_g2_i12.p2 TRINITY_DN1135_c0_g2~~TRINITY_DN1135_c0_g2_i12.p2  ORF type:complete len:119 (+),score=3.93 TRINITY_DN1135_c0_g2_i12:660-1016(+)
MNFTSGNTPKYGTDFCRTTSNLISYRDVIEDVNVVKKKKLKGNPVAAVLFGENRKSEENVWESLAKEGSSKWRPHLMVCRLCESKVPLHKYLVRFDHIRRFIQNFVQKTWSICKCFVN